MLAWILRGLRGGRVTTAYPAGREEPGPGYRGSVVVLGADPAETSLEGLCPTGAISVNKSGALSLDRGRCILCGNCVRAVPERFAFRAAYETAARARSALVEGAGADGPESVAAVRRTLADQLRALRRSIHIRHLDAGSDGSEEWEVQALLNPYYDIQRLGLYFTAAPRHADILLVTGAVTPAMREPLLRTWDVMPEPKAVIAAGTDACSGGIAPRGATAGGVDQVLPVDVYVPGSPPAPIALLHGLLLAIGRLGEVAP
jgi:Ni,Fe-hydrogenase III small subunit/ferredoxin